MRSKFGYTTSNGSGSAWLDWEQTGDKTNAHLSGPFGAGAAQVLSSSQHATLKQAGEEDVHAKSAGALTYQLFGWSFPIEQLRYWVRGVPAPHTQVSALTLDSSGLLSLLVQDGWTLSFTHYQNTPVGPLPSKIRASSGDIRIKLIIKEWLVNRENTPQQPQHLQRKEI